MAKTCNSSPTAYAQPSDFLFYLDANLTGDLVTDDGTRVTPSAILSDPVVAKHLLRASGRVESICLKGQRYSAADLQSLTGASLELLIWLVCCLSVESLRWRRANMEESRYPFSDELKQVLEDLALGESIFAFVESERAGVPSVSALTPQDYRNLNLTTSNVREWGFLPPRDCDRPVR